MTNTTLVAVRNAAVLSLFSAFVAIGSLNCGGGSSGSGAGDNCSTVCECVASKGGSASSCMSQCQQLSATSKDPKSDCESALSSNGYSTCNSTCSAFSKSPSPSPSGSSSSSSGATATIADFCEKCASCVNEPGFEEGFCTPDIKSGGGFDVAACTAAARTSSLANPKLTKSELAGLDCKGFDDAE